MIPRFSNPHLLPQFAETISRSALYDEDENNFQGYDDDLFQKLNECVKEALSLPNLAACHRKRKRAEDFEEHEVKEEATFFRLVSSTLPPVPISILPPPPPPPVTREPDAEDNADQAVVRKQRAQIASIDGQTILRESGLVKSDRARVPSQHLRVVTEYSPSNIMIVRTLQKRRKTRPPVPESDLSHFPYTSDDSTTSLPPVKSRTMHCPVVDAECADATTPKLSKRNRPRRRRKGAGGAGQQPSAQFWRPNPAWEGKCRGYAYGYPSNLACRSGDERSKYERDSMKRAVYVA